MSGPKKVSEPTKDDLNKHGAADGRRWAKRGATVEQLRRLENVRLVIHYRGRGGLKSKLYFHLFPEHDVDYDAATAFWESVSTIDDYGDRTYLRAFVAAATAVWEEKRAKSKD
jgi:hypothetical protein